MDFLAEMSRRDMLQNAHLETKKKNHHRKEWSMKEGLWLLAENFQLAVAKCCRKK